MTREQYLLGKLAEEASEIAQIALKTSQFGMDEYYLDLPSNKDRTQAEITDLVTIIHMLNMEFGCGFVLKPSNAKMDKVNNYYSYSASLGRTDNGS